MAKFLFCVFGYIIVSSLAFSGLRALNIPTWGTFVFFIAFLVGWVFVIGFATDESGSNKRSLQSAKEFLLLWGSSLKWMGIAAGVVLLGAVLFSNFRPY